MMVGADVSTELWRHPLVLIVAVLLVVVVVVINVVVVVASCVIVVVFVYGSKKVEKDYNIHGTELWPMV